MSTIVNDNNVNPNAAIAGTKIDPDFGNQTIATTGIISLGTTVATAGAMRVAHGTQIQGRNSSNAIDRILLDWGVGLTDGLRIGDTAGIATVQMRATGTISLVIGSLNNNFNTSSFETGAPQIRFINTVVSPRIWHVDDTTNSVTGDTLTVQAQNCTGTTTTGGTLALTSGTGTSANGVVNIQTAGNTALQIADAPATAVATAGTFRVANGVSIQGRNSGDTLNRILLDWSATLLTIGDSAEGTAINGLSGFTTLRTGGGIRFTVASTSLISSVTQLGFANTVVAPLINQNTDTGASSTGDVFTVQAQNCSGATSTGGNLVLTSGTGTSANGVVNVQNGGSTVAQFAGTGGAALASAGSIRLQNNTAIGWRNSTDSADATITHTSGNILAINAGSGQVQLAGSSGILLSNGVTASSTITSSAGGHSLSMNNVALTFGNSATDPSILQTTNSTATATGRAFTLHAQDVSGNTATTGGALTLRAGDATGAGGTHIGGATTIQGGDATGGSGTRTGGDLTLRSGAGANNEDGYVYINRGNTTYIELYGGSAVRQIKLHANFLLFDKDAPGDIEINQEDKTEAGSGALISISAQGATDGYGGEMFLNGGNAGTSGNGGNVTLQGGDAAGSDQNGGTITINSGTLTGAGISTVNINASGNTIMQARNNGGISELSFFSVPLVTRPDVTGATGGNAALQNLLTAIESLGLITDSTT